MSASQPTDLTLDRALKILKSYDCAQVTNTEPLVKLEELRNSLLLITSLSTSQNLGICADNFQQGFATLVSYLEAFGYQHGDWTSCLQSSVSRHQSNLEQEKVSQSSEPVYLKLHFDWKKFLLLYYKCSLYTTKR